MSLRLFMDFRTGCLFELAWLWEHLERKGSVGSGQSLTMMHEESLVPIGGEFLLGDKTAKRDLIFHNEITILY